MQFKDYVAIAKRRLNILVLVPALAVLLVAGATVVKPTAYEATATVAAPALVGGINANQYSGAAGLKTFVANFEAAVTSAPIVKKVAADTKVRASRVRGGLSATEVGTSSLMDVHYQTTNRRSAGAVAQAAASATVEFLFKTQMVLAQRPVDATSKALDDNEAAIASVVKQSGLVAPDRDFDVKLQAMTQLETQATAAAANGQTAAASRIEATVNARRAEIAALAPEVETYRTLIDKKNQLISTLNKAEQTLEQAKAQFGAADPARVVTLGATSRISVVGQLAQRGATALAGALLLSIGIVVLLELLSGRSEVAAPVLACVPDPTGQEEFAPYVVRNPFGRRSTSPSR